MMTAVLFAESITNSKIKEMEFAAWVSQYHLHYKQLIISSFSAIEQSKILKASYRREQESAMRSRMPIRLRRNYEFLSSNAIGCTRSSNLLWVRHQWHLLLAANDRTYLLYCSDFLLHSSSSLPSLRSLCGLEYHNFIANPYGRICLVVLVQLSNAASRRRLALHFDCLFIFIISFHHRGHLHPREDQISYSAL